MGGLFFAHLYTPGQKGGLFSSHVYTRVMSQQLSHFQMVLIIPGRDFTARPTVQRCTAPRDAKHSFPIRKKKVDSRIEVE